MRVNPDTASQAAGQETAPPEPAAVTSDTATLTLSTGETENSGATYVFQNGRPQPYLEPQLSIASSKPPLKQNTSLAASGASSSPATTPESTAPLLASPSTPLSGGTPGFPPSPPAQPSGSCHGKRLVSAETMLLRPDCLETEL